MLDLYAVGDLAPWPDDVPTDSRQIGSIDQRRVALVADDLERCLARVGVEGALGADWLVGADAVAELARLLHQAAGEGGRGRDVLRELAAIVEAADGRLLLAIED